jgi:hypothetical protein
MGNTTPVEFLDCLYIAAGLVGTPQLSSSFAGNAQISSFLAAVCSTTAGFLYWAHHEGINLNMALGGGAEGLEPLTGGARIGGVGGVKKREDAEAAAWGGAGGGPHDNILLRSCRDGPISSSQGSSTIV